MRVIVASSDRSSLFIIKLGRVPDKVSLRFLADDDPMTPLPLATFADESSDGHFSKSVVFHTSEREDL